MIPGDITRLIAEWQGGDSSAEQALFNALYRTLHGIAQQILRTERPGQTIGATALVHEAYLRFRRTERLDVVNRAHFLALVARVMRRIIVDRARARRAEKRGTDPYAVDLTDALAITNEDATQILAVDEALSRLSQQAPRQCKLVELRYFAGYSIEESAIILGVSPRTARREWQVARARLKVTLDGTNSGG
jgi:RNA polymerase sigma factor (TIGR02999 family)